MIGLVGCAARKLKRIAPARELYDSDLFRKSLRYAEARCLTVYVLSAALQLVPLDVDVRPYNLTLAELTSDEVRAWARGVVDKLASRHPFEVVDGERVPSTFLVLAGRNYVEPLRVALALRTGTKERVEEPLAGMMIGARLSWLKKQNEGGSSWK